MTDLEKLAAETAKGILFEEAPACTTILAALQQAVAERDELLKEALEYVVECTLPDGSPAPDVVDLARRMRKALTKP